MRQQAPEDFVYASTTSFRSLTQGATIALLEANCGCRRMSLSDCCGGNDNLGRGDKMTALAMGSIAPDLARLALFVFVSPGRDPSQQLAIRWRARFMGRAM